MTESVTGAGIRQCEASCSGEVVDFSFSRMRMRLAKPASEMRRFETYDVSMELAAAMGPIIAKLKRRDGNLSNQLKRAVTSIPLNLAEGAQRRGKDRIQHYRVASGSAAETATALSLALSWAFLTDADVARLNPLLDRLRALLWRLVEANEQRTADANPNRNPDPDPGHGTQRPVRTR